VETELGPGRSFERSLVTRTLEGLDIAPLYVADPDQSGPSFELGSGGWAIAPRVDHPAPAKANAHLLEDLTQGATGCAIQLSAASKGLADHTSAADQGVDVIDLSSMDQLLDGVFLDAIPIAFESSANALPLAATFAALCKERDVELAKTRVDFGMDPIGALARDGALPGDMEDARKELCTLASYARLHIDGGTSIAVDAGIWHRAGAHAAQELGFALATFVQYLRWLEEDGLDPAQAYVEFAWRFDVGRDVFTEIAKLRAARELHARVLGSMGLQECAPMRLTGTTSPRGLSCRDPWTNMLRTSLGVFAGATGGVDAMTALPFDESLGQASALGRRNARNTQLVLAHESRLDHVGDPTRGSHFVEARTTDLCEAAWGVFLQVEENGGMAKALEDDWIAGELDRSRAELREAVAHRKRPIVGVSEYPGAWLEGSEEERTRAAEEVQASRAAGTKRIGARGTLALGAVDHFPHAQEAAKLGATIEEIGGALVRGAPETMSPIALFREASVFERIADAALALAPKPTVFLACLGTLAEHTARAGFATQTLLAGGFDVVQGDPGLTPEEIGAAASAAGAKLACLAGNDDAYGSADATAALGALRSSGVELVYVAAPPDRAAKPLEEAGLDGHLFMGCNAEAALTHLLRHVGADLPETSA
jgi:methylmalonyl-CoA mutase